MPGPLVERLESLSGYQPVYPPHDPAASRTRSTSRTCGSALGGRPVSILSRVGPAGLDYTGRANKYAHHVVLDATERPDGGPAWLLGQPGFMQAAWDGEPRMLADGRPVPRGDRPARHRGGVGGAHRRCRLGRGPGRVVPGRPEPAGVPGLSPGDGPAAALRRGDRALAALAALGRRVQHVSHPGPGGITYACAACLEGSPEAANCAPAPEVAGHRPGAAHRAGGGRPAGPHRPDRRTPRMDRAACDPAAARRPGPGRRRIDRPADSDPRILLGAPLPHPATISSPKSARRRTRAGSLAAGLDVDVAARAFGSPRSRLPV